LLSRVARSLYRLGAAAEHADHVARVMDVHVGLALDRGRTPDAGYWTNTLELCGIVAPGAHHHETATEAAIVGVGVPSVRESVAGARRQAMAVRPSLSTEVYESLNALHWRLDATDWRAAFHDFSVDVQRGVALLYGLIDETMAHDEAWDFLRLGRQVERAGNVVLLATRKLSWLSDLDDPIEWAAVLRSCSAFEAYRWRFSAPVTPEGVARFLLLDTTLPRSARTAVAAALEGVRRVDGPGEPSAPYRLLGRLSTLFEYTVAEQVVADPVGFADAYAEIAGHLDDALSATYFRPMRVPTGQPVVAPPIWSSSQQ
jgi:uncharacterized alpha-E superfamily protein